MAPPLLKVADLRGAARLTTEAVTGVTSLVEAMHARIADPLRQRLFGEAARGDERTRGITRLVYQAVRGVTNLVGVSAETLFAWLEPVHSTDPSRAARPEREGVIAALNGVLGDHLAATDNPLAIQMALRCAGRPLRLERSALLSDLPDATPRLLVLLHGLCMNDLQWRRAGHGHGEALARDLGYTPVYLHYNSGLSVASNGRMLAQQMQRLVDAWPVPLERLAMVGHSMGGLVARSALHQGALMQRSGWPWPACVQDLVCLGTPHQGAPLERAGHGIDILLGAAPFAAPLARLGRVRSAGINDLRWGHVLDTPPGGEPRLRQAPVPLPGATRCYAVAATLGPSAAGLKARWLGDGLVPLGSALGQHRDPRRRLDFAAERQAVVPATGHLDLLSSAEVYGLLKRWLA